MSDTDDLIDAVRDYLVGQWDARVDVLNALPVPVTLAHLAMHSISDPEVTRDPAFQGYPALYVLADRSRVEHWLRADLSVNQMSHRIEVGVAALDQDKERLQRMIWYYVEDVVWYLIRAGHAVDSIGFNIAEGEIIFEWGPVLTAGAEKCYQDAKISVPFTRR